MLNDYIDDILKLKTRVSDASTYCELLIFALLALVGDLGCSSGPTFVGIVSGNLGVDLKKGILAAVIFSVILIGGLWYNKCSLNT